jgi:preprotein translocase subunit SecG
MDGMLLAVAAVVVLLLVIAALLLSRRSGRGDFGSVERYHTAVSTLEHMPERVGRTPLRIVEPAGRTPGPSAAADPVDGTGRGDGADVPAPPVADPAPSVPVDPAVAAARRMGPGGTRVPPVRVRGSEEFPDPETPLVFDDARPREARAGDLPAGPTSPPRASRSQRHALDAMNHGNRRQTAVILVALVVVVFVVLAVIGRHRGNHAATATTGTRHAGHPAASTTLPTRHHSATGHRPTPTTTTTLPTQFVPTPTSANAATYHVPAAPFTLTVAATSPSWISVTSASTGASVWAGLVPAGGHQAVTGTGSLDVDVGAPGITLTVDRIPVVLPAPFHTPSILSFVVGGPAGSGGAPASTTTTTAAPSDSTTTTVPATPGSTTGP